MKQLSQLTFAISLLLTPYSSVAAQPDWNLTLQVDLGTDLGQNFGTLFQLVDENDQVIAGAGYVGSYNTQSRSDRRALHFFVKPEQDESFQPTVLPKPTTDAGTYLYDFDGKLFSKGRGGKDSQLKLWNTNSKSWSEEKTIPPFGVSVADGVLASDQQHIYYNDNTILTVDPSQGVLSERYYANGYLVFRRHGKVDSQAVNQLIACPWKSSQSDPIDWKAGQAIDMGTPNEFVYAYGQLESQIVAATNTGGLYVFDGSTWKTVLEPDTTVSFQIYTILNYGDKLLMGQYPTGEIFTYDGTTLKHVPDWPPAIPGVQKRAREAQTLTIYGGNIYAGVWPWGEVWKTADPTAGWQFSGRMFSHPEPTDKTTHPYEAETDRLKQVLNRWGQRVTSLVPVDDSLYISTSSKGGTAYDTRFNFLTETEANQYGAVYQYRHPGTLVATTQWSEGKTTIDFRIAQGKLEVRQDGKLIGSAQAASQNLADLKSAKLQLGTGLFGPYRGKSIQTK